MKDNEWLLLILMLAYMNPNVFEQAEKDRKVQDLKKKLREECPALEWEQDMGATIPFCKLDNELCNFQCLGEHK